MSPISFTVTIPVMLQALVVLYLVVGVLLYVPFCFAANKRISPPRKGRDIVWPKHDKLLPTLGRLMMSFLVWPYLLYYVTKSRR